MPHASWINEEVQASWNQMTASNAALQAQLSSAESSSVSEQQDYSMRIDAYIRIRSELAACIARESVWKQELEAAKLEIQQFSVEAIALRNHTLSDVRSIQGEYHKATSELIDVTGHFFASKSMLTNFE